MAKSNINNNLDELIPTCDDCGGEIGQWEENKGTSLEYQCVECHGFNILWINMAHIRRSEKEIREGKYSELEFN